MIRIMQLPFILVGLVLVLHGSQANQCTNRNKDIVARIVFGEARGEPFDGQVAVAFTIMNRASHPGFPRDVSSVAYQRMTNNKFQYETLDLESHSQAYRDHKRRRTWEYKNALDAATMALCPNEVSASKREQYRERFHCFVNYCAFDPCHSTKSNDWWEAYNKTKLGGHYFVCLKSKAG